LNRRFEDHLGHYQTDTSHPPRLIAREDFTEFSSRGSPGIQTLRHFTILTKFRLIHESKFIFRKLSSKAVEFPIFKIGHDLFFDCHLQFFINTNPVTRSNVTSGVQTNSLNKAFIFLSIRNTVFLDHFIHLTS